MNKKMYDDLLNFKREDLENIQPHIWWDSTPNDAVKHYAKGIYDDNDTLVKVCHLGAKYGERYLDISFYQRKDDMEKPYILGKDEYYIEVFLSSTDDEYEWEDSNPKFKIEDIIFKKIRKVSDIYNITNLCEEFSYELGNDLFKTINMENDTYGDGESNLTNRLMSTLNERKDSGVGNEFLSDWVLFTTYSGLSFIYHEDDIKS